MNRVLETYCSGCNRHFASKAKRAVHDVLVHKGNQIAPAKDADVKEILAQSKIRDRTCEECDRIFFSKQCRDRHTLRHHNGDASPKIIDCSSDTSGDRKTVDKDVAEHSGAPVATTTHEEKSEIDEKPGTEGGSNKKLLQAVLTYFYYAS